MNNHDTVSVFVGIGSNIEPRTHIPQALRLLQRRFGVLQVSQVYECPAVGFEGDAFCNLVIGFDSNEAPLDVVHALRDIEQQCGRSRSETMRSRTIDLDLLLYGERILDDADLRVPRRDIMRYAFVLKPLVELMPDGRHPADGRRYADLWADFDASEQPLKAVDLSL